MPEKLAALERKRFLRREPGSEDEYVFEHILVRDVAYEQIPRAERAHRHRLAAEWLGTLSERTDDRVELLDTPYSTANGQQLTQYIGQFAVFPCTASQDRLRIPTRVPSFIGAIGAHADGLVAWTDTKAVEAIPATP